MRLIDEAIVALIHDKKERFYGNLLLQMNIQETTNLPTAGVNVTNKINLYYNPDFFASLCPEQRVELLKHECAHVYQNHFERYELEKISFKDPIAAHDANVAADASINYDLKNLCKDNGVTIARLNEAMREKDKNHVDLPEHETFEYYYYAIKEFKKRNNIPNEIGDLKPVDDHSLWAEGYDKDTVKEIIKQGVNKAVDATGGVGTLPSDIIPHIQRLNKSEVNWRAVLRNFFVSTQSLDKEHTRTKRNRRYGIIQKGRKKKPNLHIAFIVDTSGSMSDQALSQAWAELDKIYQSIEPKITVIEADSQVQNVYDFDPKKKPEFKGRGGTAYQPSLDKAKELKVDGIVFFGDCDCADTPVDPKKPFLWAIVGRQDPPASFGRSIRITVKGE